MTVLGNFLADMSRSATLAADLENDYEFWTRYGRGPGGHVSESPTVSWFSSGIPDPFFNGIVHFSAPDAEADAAIESVLAHFRTRGVAVEWMVTPAMRPLDLGRRLEGRGLQHVFRAVGMAAEIETLRGPPVPDGLTIRRVLDRSMLEQWAHVVLRCFDLPDSVYDAFVELEARFGPAWDRPGRRYLGFVDGKAVASSMVYYGAGVAGIYYVGTILEARGRGIGAAMAAAPLKDASALGYRIGVLEATPMGEPVYRKMGFREHARYDLFVTRDGVSHASRPRP